MAGTPSAPKGLDGFDGVEPVDDESVCLDIACGTGEQSIWAARHGFRVVALEVSPVAIDARRRVAGEAGLEHLVDGRIVDLDEGLPADVAGLCSLVVCQRFRDPRLYPAIAEAARPGGLIVVTVLSCVGLSSDAGPFHAAPGEFGGGVRFARRRHRALGRG